MKDCLVDDVPAPPEVQMALRGFLARLKDRPEAGDVVLFGSVARGTFGSGSDVDLLVDWQGDPREARALFALWAEEILGETGVMVAAFPADPAYKQRSAALDSRFYHAVQDEGLRVAA